MIAREGRLLRSQDRFVKIDRLAFSRSVCAYVRASRIETCVLKACPTTERALVPSANLSLLTAHYPITIGTLWNSVCESTRAKPRAPLAARSSFVPRSHFSP